MLPRVPLSAWKDSFSLRLYPDESHDQIRLVFSHPLWLIPFLTKIDLNLQLHNKGDPPLLFLISSRLLRFFLDDSPAKQVLVDFSAE